MKRYFSSLIGLLLCLSAFSKDDLFLFSHSGKEFYYSDFFGKNLSESRIDGLRQRGLEEVSHRGSGEILFSIPSPGHRDFSDAATMYDYLLHHLDGLIEQYLISEALKRVLYREGIKDAVDSDLIMDSYLNALMVNVEARKYLSGIFHKAFEEGSSHEEFVKRVRDLDVEGRVPDRSLEKDRSKVFLDQYGFSKFHNTYLPQFKGDSSNWDLNYFSVVSHAPAYHNVWVRGLIDLYWEELSHTMKYRYYRYDAVELLSMKEGDIDKLLSWWESERDDFESHLAKGKGRFLRLPWRWFPVHYWRQEITKQHIFEMADGEVDFQLKEGYAILGSEGERRVFLFPDSKPSKKPEWALDVRLGFPLFREALDLLMMQPLEEVIEEVEVNPELNLRDPQSILASWGPSPLRMNNRNIKGNPSTGWNEDEMVELVREIIRDAKKAKLGDDEQGFLSMLRNGEVLEAVEKYWDIPKALELYYDYMYEDLSPEDRSECVNLYGKIIVAHFHRPFHEFEEGIPVSEHVIEEAEGNIRDQFGDIIGLIDGDDPDGVHIVFFLAKDGQRKIVDHWGGGASASMLVMGLVGADPDNLPPLTDYLKRLKLMVQHFIP